MLYTTTTLPFRAAKPLSLLSRPSTTQFRTISSTPATSPWHKTSCLRRPISCTLKPHRPLPSSRLARKPAQSRHASSSAAASPAPGTTASSTAAAEPETLTWNRFLALRKTRRRISLVASIISALASTAGGAFVLSTRDIDAMGSQILGLDPIFTLGLATIACGTAGWLIGPFFGNAAFGVVYRRYTTQIASKEREFFARIKKHRVDPQASSLNNPVPDYYGEKIGSVADYRRWLKDQRAFNLKRGRML